MGKKLISAYNWEGVNNNPDLSTKDIAKILKEQFKKEFPKAKWSITTDYNEIRIALMEYDKRISESDYIDLSACNSAIHNKLSEEGQVMLQRVHDLAQSFNYNDSNAYIDYFDVGFYLNLSIGRYDKPFKVVNK